jgi:transcriptional regulator with GAF, ATPase, and Fis domain
VADDERATLIDVGNKLVGELRRHNELVAEQVELVRQSAELSKQQAELVKQQTDILRRSPAMTMPRRYYSVSMVVLVLLIIGLALMLLFIYRLRG